MIEKNKRLVIVIIENWYHPDAPGRKSKITEFYNLQEAEKYYFEAQKDDDLYCYTTIDIHIKGEK